MKKCTTTFVAFALALSGCADKSSEISGAYVSPLQYQGYSCSQLRQEAQRVSARASQIAGVQDKKAENDAVATGVALVLFWPAVFFIGGNKETRAELARLKGELDAIEQAGIQRNCNIQVRSG